MKSNQIKNLPASMAEIIRTTMRAIMKVITKIKRLKISNNIIKLIQKGK